MKKIFSFMLIAVGLLISGQMKAANVAKVTIGDIETEYSTLLAAFNAAKGNTATIKMLDHATDLEAAMEVGQGKSIALGTGSDITWDLAGKTVSMKNYQIHLKYAKLTIVNSVSGEGGINVEGKYTNSENVPFGNNPTSTVYVPFVLFGSNDPNVSEEYYTMFTVEDGVTINSNVYFASISNDGYSPAAAFGVNIVMNGYVNSIWGISINGNIQQGTGTVPEIHINGTIVGCIYCAGYAKWYVTGTIDDGEQDSFGEYNAPVYIKAGEVYLDGATIIADAPDYHEPVPNGNGSTAWGSAIVIDSHVAYTKGYEMVVNISGDTKVYSAKGYAIEEVVTKGDDKLPEIVISSGTFECEEKACVKTTDVVKQQIKNNGTITGGTFSSEEIKDYVGNIDGVIDVQAGDETKYVVNGMPEGKTWVSTIAAAGATDYVKITANEEVASDKTIAYLNIPGANKVTVKSGAKLSVGEVVLGELAVIEVEAGGTLIVNGTNGLIAFETSNLVLKADASGYGKFVLNPDVKANKTPYATVEFYAANARAMDKGYRWDIFVCPFVSIDYLMGNMTEEDILEGKTLGSAYQYWNGTQWVSCSTKQQLLDNAGAFMPIAITNTCNKDHRCTYTMKGQLQGNISGVFNVERGFNYFGNGFMADMSAQDMMDAIVAQSNKVESVIYIWNAQNQRFQDFQSNNIGSMPDLKGTDFFILKATANDAVDLDYKTLVWDKNK